MKFARFGSTFGILATALLIGTASTTVPAAETARTAYQTANLVDFTTGVPVLGAATLIRAENDLRARIAAGALDPNAAYTIWWVVWNDPRRCNGACGGDDIGIPGNSVFYAAGFLTGTDGTANVSAELSAGRLPNGLDVLVPGGLQPGRGLRAEVHMVIRSHGPALVGSVASQIGQFDAACVVCVDQQAVVFAPIS
jgi:hypothetical protein